MAQIVSQKKEVQRKIRDSTSVNIDEINNIKVEEKSKSGKILYYLYLLNTVALFTASIFLFYFPPPIYPVYPVSFIIRQTVLQNWVTSYRDYQPILHLLPTPQVVPPSPPIIPIEQNDRRLQIVDLSCVRFEINEASKLHFLSNIFTLQSILQNLTIQDENDCPNLNSLQIFELPTPRILRAKFEFTRNQLTGCSLMQEILQRIPSLDSDDIYVSSSKLNLSTWNTVRTKGQSLDTCR